MPTPLFAAALLLTAAPDAPQAPPSDAPRAAPTAVAPLPPDKSAPLPRATRITIELLVSAAVGVGAGAIGGYAGCLATPSNNGQTCNTATVAAVGLTTFGLSVAAVVPLAGDAMGGNGSFWVSWLGEAAGLGGGLALAQGNPKNALYFCPPFMLVGAIVGYELTSGWGQPDATGVVKAVAISPVHDGGVLSVAGRF
jgi:hypothetical protein